MMEKIKHTILTGAILSMLPVLTMAQLPNKAQAKITGLCKSAIEKKGYSDYTYKYVEVIKAQSGNYGMTGQLHKETKRFEFNCALNKDLAALKIDDLVINSLD